MRHNLQFYIDGEWVDALGGARLAVEDPATEQPCAEIALGTAADVDRAVTAARRAFVDYSRWSREHRLDLLRAIVAVYTRRGDDLADAVTSEMGAPLPFARKSQVPAGLGHLNQAIEVLTTYAFDETIRSTVVTREPIGVCGLITPWNWPLNQIGCKVGPALAAGCTMVLKPSELAPLSALVFAEILHEAGVPRGVFNLVNGDGPTVGQAIATHPQVDMVSFTGSTRAGVAVARAAADTIKRVTQELGGKSPNLVLEDADFERAIPHAVTTCFRNSGQSCNAPTRLIVPASRHDEACAIAKRVADAMIVGDPRAEATTLGPVAGKVQFAKVQRLIEAGIREGATLVAGGPGRPAGLERGYYVRPTVFGHVRNEMTIAREEIFGPVLAILPCASEEEAIAIANDTPYGLSSYVTAGDPDRAHRVARAVRAGMVHLNGAPADYAAPFSGYKQSGNGREWGRYGFEEFLEVKSMFGYVTA